jgi:hypothetical protein
MVCCASAIAGLLWTAVSPRVAFGYLASWMVLALVGLLATRRGLTERQSRAGRAAKSCVAEADYGSLVTMTILGEGSLGRDALGMVGAERAECGCAVLQHCLQVGWLGGLAFGVL